MGLRQNEVQGESRPTATVQIQRLGFKSPASPLMTHLSQPTQHLPAPLPCLVPVGQGWELGPQLSRCIWLPAGVRHLEGLQGQQCLVDATDGWVGVEINLEPVGEKHLVRQSFHGQSRQ